MRRLFGKYGGSVVANTDPMLLGRLQVTAPAALGDATVWAWPCVPFAGKGVGMLALPPVDSNVWVEFEAGDPDHPIWSGCFWSTAEMPSSMGLPQQLVIKTQNATLTLSDLLGITIETADGKKISITPAGIEINDGAGGTISLQGPKVTINKGALEVT